MPTPRLETNMDRLREVVAAVQKHGNVSAAAMALGARDSTLRRQYRRAKELGLVEGEPSVADTPPPDPVKERRTDADLAFLRARNRDLGKALERAERLVEELGGIRQAPVQIPRWLPSADAAGATGKAVIGMLCSDWHCGEVVRPDEIDGLNGYDIDVFRARVRRYFAAVIEIGPRWTADCECVGAVLWLAGDMISGDIHEELRNTNALTALEQVKVVVEELARAIELLLAAFERVHVVSVPGNHGRTTQKPPFKGYTRLSYDTLAADMTRAQLGDIEGLTWQISSGIDATTPVLGWNVMVTHGDRMGTGGGQGFAGPFLPIVRGQKRVEIQQFRARRSFDLLLSGHYHTSGQPGPHLTSGSLPGYTEFGHGIRAAVEPPQQWLFVIHNRWLLRDRAEIKLEDPLPPPKPRVRVPAVMAEAA